MLKSEKDRKFVETLTERYRSRFERYQVPESMKETACLIMFRFTIDGESDGMYICNTIAHENGFGDGKGNFTESEQINARKTAETLQDAYGKNICRYAVEELALILDTGMLNYSMARAGILRDIRDIKEEYRQNANWRRVYLKKLIQQKEEDLDLVVKMLGSNVEKIND